MEHRESPGFSARRANFPALPPAVQSRQLVEVFSATNGRFDGMEPETWKTRACPKCGSQDYLFRGRKKVGENGTAAMETKYRCKTCGNEWKEKTEVQ
jgi:DNA-directed RNA polymerase subunit M/transcription elongation factor TFIIS